MTSSTRKTITAVRYLVASLIPVVFVWGYELGKEGFNALLRDPWADPFSWFVLFLGIAQAMCQAVGALMNADLTKGQLPPIPDGAPSLRTAIGKDKNGPGA